VRILPPNSRSRSQVRMSPTHFTSAANCSLPMLPVTLCAVMRDRTEKVLSLAILHGYEGLVLGAWGCGVFSNDPATVARCFGQLLTGAGLFRDAFRRVVFAVRDRTTDSSTIRPFGQLFAGTV